MAAIQTAEEIVIFECVRICNKLRVRIREDSARQFRYSPHANTQFPRELRVEGRTFSVPKHAVSFKSTANRFYYSVTKKNITILDTPPAAISSRQLVADQLRKDVEGKPLIFGDFETECAICMDNIADIVFIPCGHVCACSICAAKMGKCPYCRVSISGRATRDQL